MNTARLFWLTLPSGRRFPVKAYTLAELQDAVLAHYHLTVIGDLRYVSFLWAPVGVPFRLAYLEEGAL